MDAQVGRKSGKDFTKEQKVAAAYIFINAKRKQIDITKTAIADSIGVPESTYRGWVTALEKELKSSRGEESARNSASDEPPPPKRFCGDSRASTADLARPEDKLFKPVSPTQFMVKPLENLMNMGHSSCTRPMAVGPTDSGIRVRRRKSPATSSPASPASSSSPPRRSGKDFRMWEKIEAIERVAAGEIGAHVARDIRVAESTLRGWIDNEPKLRHLWETVYPIVLCQVVYTVKE